jgi:two-component system chemotaxis response regulator CheY
MVIDDSRAMRAILARMLRALGFDVVEAANGQEALDRLQTLRELPVIALVDWNMPVMNGLDFVTKVRAREEWRNIALMMVTTESEYSQIVRRSLPARTSTSSSPSPRTPSRRS